MATKCNNNITVESLPVKQSIVGDDYLLVYNSNVTSRIKVSDVVFGVENFDFYPELISIIDKVDDITLTTTSNSANWTDTYNTVHTNSASWGTLSDPETSTLIDEIKLNKDRWTNTAITVESGSAAWERTRLAVDQSADRWTTIANIVEASQSQWDSAYAATRDGISAIHEALEQIEQSPWYTYMYSGSGGDGSGGGGDSDNTLLLNSIYSTVYANSSRWEEIDIPELYEQQLTSVYNNVISNSAQWNTPDIPQLYADKISQLESDISIVNTNGNKWDWAHGIVSTNYTNWNQTHARVTADYVNWSSTHSAVRSTSGTWDSSSSIVLSNHSKWQDTYNKVTTDASKWDSTYNRIQASGGFWDAAYVAINSKESSWDSAHDRIVADADDWSEAYNTVTTRSTLWDAAQLRIIDDAPDWDRVTKRVDDYGNNWDSAFTKITTTASTWDSIATRVNNSGDDWDRTYMAVISNSANWDTHTDVTSITNIIQSNSADWNSTFGSSDRWNSLYTFVESDSSTNNTTYNQATYVHQTGGTITGDVTIDSGVLRVVGDIHATGDLYVNKNSIIFSDEQTWSSNDSTKAKSIYNNYHSSSASYLSTVNVVEEKQEEWSISFETVDARGAIWDQTTLRVDTSAEKWDVAEALVQAKHTDWSGTHDIVDDNKSLWTEAYTKVDSNYNKWNTAYDTILAKEGDWNAAVTTLDLLADKWDATRDTVIANETEWTYAYTQVNANKTHWDNTYIRVNTRGDKWDDTFERVDDFGDNWDRTYSIVTTNSAMWSTHTDVTGLTLTLRNSSYWEDAYSVVSTNSGDWFSPPDLVSLIYSNSGMWNGAYSFVNADSATNNTEYNRNIFVNVSGDEITGNLAIEGILTAETTLNVFGDIIFGDGHDHHGVVHDEASLESLTLQNVRDFKQVQSTVVANSGVWFSPPSITSLIQNNSGMWDGAYSFVHTDSATNNTEYNRSTFVNVSGDEIVGDLIVDGNVVFEKKLNLFDELIFGDGIDHHGVVHDETSLEPLSLQNVRDFKSIQSVVVSNSADWLTPPALTLLVQTNSGNWNSVYSTVQANSSLWFSPPELTALIESSSGKWDAAHTFVISESATNNTDYNRTNFFNVSGDTITGELSVKGDVIFDQQFVVLDGEIVFGDSVHDHDWDHDPTAIERLTIQDVRDFKSVESSVVATSSDWDSVYSTVNFNSGDWFSPPELTALLQSNSANWINTHASVHSSSGSWNSVYDSVCATSGTWNNTTNQFNTNKPRWDSVHSFVTADSSTNNTEYNRNTFVNISGDKITGDLTINGVLSGTSAIFSSITALSSVVNVIDIKARELSGYDIIDGDLSIGHELLVKGRTGVDSDINIVNGAILFGDGLWNHDTYHRPDLLEELNKEHVVQFKDSYSALITTSADWDSVYNSVLTTSAKWDSTYEDVRATSGDWDSTHESVLATSADWDSAYNSVLTTSADWDSTHESVLAASADWDSTHESVLATSAEWDSVYNFVNSDSATNNTEYNRNTFVNVGGDTITGNLDVIGTLSGTSAIFTSITAISSFVDVIDIKVRELSGYEIIDGELVVHDDITAANNLYVTNGAIIFGDSGLYHNTPHDPLATETLTKQNLRDFKSVYNSVLTTSSTWDSVYGNVLTNSGSWDSVYSLVNSDSATNNTEYNKTTFVNVTGDTITGSLDIEKHLHVHDDINIEHGSLWFGHQHFHHGEPHHDVDVEELSRENVVQHKSTHSSVHNTSGDWDSTHVSVLTNSSNWDNTHISMLATSAKWDSTYNSVCATSAVWDSTHASVYTTSANWDNTHTSVLGTSGDWDSTHTSVFNSSANWNGAYNFVHTDSATNNTGYNSSAFVNVSGDTITGDLTVAGQLSATTGIFTSLTALSTVINVIDIKARELSGYDIIDGDLKIGHELYVGERIESTNDINLINGQILFGDGTWDHDIYHNEHLLEELNREDVVQFKNTHNSVLATSSTWDSVYGSVLTTSGDWDSTHASVLTTSANWDSTHNSLLTTSGNWDSTHISVLITSGNWDSTHASVLTTSANWDSTHASVLATSAEWDSVYNSVLTTSADWDSVYSSVLTTSAEWDSVYSFVNSDSATNNTQYNRNTFVNVSGDTITGDLEVQQKLITKTIKSNDPTSALKLFGGTENRDGARLELYGANNNNSNFDGRIQLHTNNLYVGDVYDTVDGHLPWMLRIDVDEKNFIIGGTAAIDGSMLTVIGDSVLSGKLDVRDTLKVTSDATFNTDIIIPTGKIILNNETLNKDDVKNFKSVYTSVLDTSGDWDSTHSSVLVTSGDWDSTYNSVLTTSANWDSTHASVLATSGVWDSTYVSVLDTSGDWDSAYAFVNSDSATNNTEYNRDTFVNVSGDTITGDLTIEGQLSATTGIFTSLTALSTVINVIDIKARELSGYDIIDGDLRIEEELHVGERIESTNDINLINGQILFGDGTWDHDTYHNEHLLEKLGRDHVRLFKSTHASVLTTSAQWDSVYGSVLTTSATWDSVHASVLATSGDWDSTHVSVHTTSANWDSTHASVHATSGDWDSVYNFVHTDSATNNTGYNSSAFVNVSGDTITGSLCITDDLTVDGNVWFKGDGLGIINLGDSESDKVVFNGLVDSDVTPNSNKTYNLGASANQWNTIFTTELYASSGISLDDDLLITHGDIVFGDAHWAHGHAHTPEDLEKLTKQNVRDFKNTHASVLATSGNWDSTHASVCATSGNWDSTHASVCATSGNWDSTYDSVLATSGNWDSTHASVCATSGNWDSTYDSVLATSANWDSTHNSVLTTSGDWDSTYDSVLATSANWDSTHESVHATSGDWDSVYNFVNTDSATNNTEYNRNTFVNVSGDTITGGLDIIGTLSGTNAIFTSITAISSVVDVIDIKVRELSGYDIIDGDLRVEGDITTNRLLLAETDDPFTQTIPSWSTSNLHDDDSSGVSDKYKYTHAVNVYGTEDYLINGILFESESTGQGINWELTSGVGDAIINESTTVSESIGQMIGDRYRYIVDDQKVILKGLTVGKKYLFTLYNQAWSTDNVGKRAEITSSASIHSIDVTQNEFEDQTSDGQLINYIYFANSNQVEFTIKPTDDSTWNLYAFSNREVWYYAADTLLARDVTNFKNTYTTVSSNSGNWDSVYTFVNSDSATNHTEYNQNTFVNVSGDTMSGALSVKSELTVDNDTRLSGELLVGGYSNFTGGVTADSNVYIKGDLRVDGNVWMLANIDSVLYVGESVDDVVVFRAPVDSDIYPFQDAHSSIGNEDKYWKSVYTQQLILSGGVVLEADQIERISQVGVEVITNSGDWNESYTQMKILTAETDGLVDRVDALYQYNVSNFDDSIVTYEPTLATFIRDEYHKHDLNPGDTVIVAAINKVYILTEDDGTYLDHWLEANAKPNVLFYRTNLNDYDIIDSFDITKFKSAKYIIEVAGNDQVLFTEVTLVTNGKRVLLTEYGMNYTTENAFVEFDATLNHNTSSAELRIKQIPGSIESMWNPGALSAKPFTWLDAADESSVILDDGGVFSRWNNRGRTDLRMRTYPGSEPEYITSGDELLNGNNVLKFTSDSDFLESEYEDGSSIGKWDEDPQTWYMVFKPTGIDNFHDYLVWFKQFTDEDDQIEPIAIVPGDNDEFFGKVWMGDNELGEGNYPFTKQYSPTDLTGEWNIFELEIDPIYERVSMYLNGNMIQKDMPMGYKFPRNAQHMLRLHANWIGNEYTDGYFAEFLVLPDYQRVKTEGYLAWKWGLQDKLPDNHIYKNVGPYMFHTVKGNRTNLF